MYMSGVILSFSFESLVELENEAIGSVYCMQLFVHWFVSLELKAIGTTECTSFKQIPR